MKLTKLLMLVAAAGMLVGCGPEEVPPVTQYTITFVDEDDNVLSTAKYDEGTLAADVVVPEKEVADADKPYIVRYDATVAPEIVDVIADATYVVSYEEVLTDLGYVCDFAEALAYWTWRGDKDDLTENYWESNGIILATAALGMKEGETQQGLTVDGIQTAVTNLFTQLAAYGFASEAAWAETQTGSGTYACIYASSALQLRVRSVAYEQAQGTTTFQVLQYQVSLVTPAAQ